MNVHRDHQWDPNGRPPFKVVDAAQQRAAMKLLTETAFAPPTYDPELLNHLASSRWNHWGMRQSTRIDYPIHDYVGMMQDRLLDQLLSPTTLTRMQDNELKVAADAEAYTMAEHLNSLVSSVFSEWKAGDKAGEFTNRKPYISSFRRNLQRSAVKRLATLVTTNVGAPEDARTLARMHLAQLDKDTTALLEKQDLKLDDYTRAHLLDSQSRIRQVLNADIELRSVN